jgi:hypothetical protein
MSPARQSSLPVHRDPAAAIRFSDEENSISDMRPIPKTGIPFIFRYLTMVSGRTTAVIWLYITSGLRREIDRKWV